MSLWVISKFKGTLVRARATIAINNLRLSWASSTKISLFRIRFSPVVCFFRSILSWSGTKWDLDLRSYSEILCFRVVTKLIEMVIRSWSTAGIRYDFFTSSLIFKVSRLRTLFDSSISLLVLILAWTGSKRNLDFRSQSELLSFRIITKLSWILIGTRSSVWFGDNLLSSCLILKVPSLRALLDCNISLFMLILTWTRTQWNFNFRSNTEFLSFRVITKFIRMVIGSWSSVRFRDHLLTTNLIFPIPLRISVLYNTISFFMLIITRTWADWNVDLWSYTKFLSLWIVTKLARVFISTRASIWFRGHFFTPSLIFKVSRLRTLLDSSISLLMLILAWTGTKRNLVFRSHSKFLSLWVIAKFIRMVISARSPIRFRKDLFSSSVIIEVISWVALFHHTVSVLVFIFSGTGT